VNDELPSPLERRLRRLAVVVPALAVVATVSGCVPDTMAKWSVPWGLNGREYVPDHVELTYAGGVSLAVWTALHGLLARMVHHHPTRGLAIWWFVTAVIMTPVAFVMWSITEHDIFLFADFAPRGLGHVTFACAGAAVVLVVVVLPIVALASSRTKVSDAPTARVV
jgi:hypothetical protein